jgi:inosine/xanthosine triphosphate pyrophosphatase family protein
VTGNKGKAEELARHLEFPVLQRKLDLEEIQALSLEVIVRVKAEAAYTQVGTPVLVEDVSLAFPALGRLPGPLVKWFLRELKQSPIGQGGFGWDPIFIPDGHHKTWAEMSPEKRAQTSMRGKALPKLERFLN